MGGRTSTTRPKGNGASIHGSHGAAKGERPQFTPDTQPPPMHKSVGHEARAEYKERLRARNDAALAVIDRALELGATATEAPLLSVGVKAAFEVLHADHGRPNQAVTGEDGGPLTVVVRRLVDDAADSA